MNPSTEEKVISLSADQHLEAILYQFVQLYERFLEERKELSRQMDLIEHSVDALSELIVHLESLEKKVKSTIQKSIEVEAEKTVVYLKKTLASEVSQHVQPMMDQLQKKLNGAVDPLIHHSSRFRFTVAEIKMMMVTVLTSVCLSVCFVKWLMPVPVLPLTEAQWKTYTLGRQFEAFWPRLSKAKQQWFLEVKNKNEIF